MYIAIENFDRNIYLQQPFHPSAIFNFHLFYSCPPLSCSTEHPRVNPMKIYPKAVTPIDYSKFIFISFAITHSKRNHYIVYYYEKSRFQISSREMPSDTRHTVYSGFGFGPSSNRFVQERRDVFLSIAMRCAEHHDSIFDRQSI